MIVSHNWRHHTENDSQSWKVAIQKKEPGLAMPSDGRRLRPVLI
jgi:hypothetical protein